MFTTGPVYIVTLIMLWVDWFESLNVFILVHYDIPTLVSFMGHTTICELIKLQGHFAEGRFQQFYKSVNIVLPSSEFDIIDMDKKS